jgi:hypothetical protein
VTSTRDPIETIYRDEAHILWRALLGYTSNPDIDESRLAPGPQPVGRRTGEALERVTIARHRDFEGWNFLAIVAHA